jgi:hypothetical protein
VKIKFILHVKQKVYAVFMGYAPKNCLLYEKIMFGEEKKLRIFYMLQN